MATKIGDVEVVNCSDVTIENLQIARKAAAKLSSRNNYLEQQNIDQGERIVELLNEAEERDLEITELKNQLYSTKQAVGNYLSLLRDYHVAYNALHRDPSSVNKQRIESIDAQVLKLITDIITQGGRIKFADDTQGTANDNELTTGS